MRPEKVCCGVMLAAEARISHELRLVLGVVQPKSVDEWELLAGLNEVVWQQRKGWKQRKRLKHRKQQDKGVKRGIDFGETIKRVLIEAEVGAACLDEGDGCEGTADDNEDRWRDGLDGFPVRYGSPRGPGAAFF